MNFIFSANIISTDQKKGKKIRLIQLLFFQPLFKETQTYKKYEKEYCFQTDSFKNYSLQLAK